MPKVKGGAQARINFLISKFVMVPVPNEKDKEVRFDYKLPRAASLLRSVNAAMVAEGLQIPPDSPSIEVSDEDHHFINFVNGLFAAVNPNIDPNAERIHQFEQTYEFAITKNFTSRSMDNPADILRHRANYKAPTPLAELRTVKNEYWYLITLALRKSCDSPQTSILWNVAQNLRDDTIEWFVNLVYGAVTAQQYATTEELAEAVKKAVMNDHTYMGNHERASIHCTCKLFNDDDWAGMISNIIVWQWEIDERNKLKGEQK
jgi:hypothetical protein